MKIFDRRPSRAAVSLFVKMKRLAPDKKVMGPALLFMCFCLKSPGSRSR